MLKTFSTFDWFNYSNKGPVCTLCLPHDISRTALFCGLNILLDLKPHTRMANFNEIFIEIHTFSFKKIHFIMSSAEWRPFCLGLNVLSLLITPKDIEILYEIFGICAFQCAHQLLNKENSTHLLFL